MKKPNVLIWLSVIVAGFVMAYYYHLKNNAKAAMAFADFVNKFDDGTVYNTKENPFLQGYYAPVIEEHSTIELVQLEGSLPVGFEGLFLRNGPNPFPTDVSRKYHWFDGHGMIHLVRFKDGKALYSNQYIQTIRYKLEKIYNRPIFIRFGEVRGFIGLFKIIFIRPLIFSAFKINALFTGQANTAFTLYNNKIYAGHEGSLLFEIQFNDESHRFDSIGYESINNQLNYPISAHSKVDPYDGNLYINCYSTDADKSDFKQGAINKTTLQTYYDVNATTKTFGHDFMITKNYILTIDPSIETNPLLILSNKDYFFFSKHKKLRIGVTLKEDNSSRKTKWFESDQSMVIVHTLNAWEDPVTNEIVLWAPVSIQFTMESSNTPNKFTMTEFRLNLQTNTMLLHTIDNASFIADKHNVEFPRVHATFIGRPSEYGYAVEFSNHSSNIADFQGIVKYNLFQCTTDKIITLPNGYAIGEVIPIPKENNGLTTSDNVYLGAFVRNFNLNQSEWHLYDGTTMDQQPIVKFVLPNQIRVPNGFHAEWVSEKYLQAHLLLGQMRKTFKK